ncbi:unnamed protein product, partial [Prorocentrum cordatum]
SAVAMLARPALEGARGGHQAAGALPWRRLLPRAAAAPAGEPLSRALGGRHARLRGVRRDLLGRGGLPPRVGAAAVARAAGRYPRGGRVPLLRRQDEDGRHRALAGAAAHRASRRRPRWPRPPGRHSRRRRHAVRRPLPERPPRQRRLQVLGRPAVPVARVKGPAAAAEGVARCDRVAQARARPQPHAVALPRADGADRRAALVWLPRSGDRHPDRLHGLLAPGRAVRPVSRVACATSRRQRRLTVLGNHSGRPRAWPRKQDRRVRRERDAGLGGLRMARQHPAAAQRPAGDGPSLALRRSALDLRAARRRAGQRGPRAAPAALLPAPWGGVLRCDLADTDSPRSRCRAAGGRPWPRGSGSLLAAWLGRLRRGPRDRRLPAAGCEPGWSALAVARLDPAGFHQRRVAGHALLVMERRSPRTAGAPRRPSPSRRLHLGAPPRAAAPRGPFADRGRQRDGQVLAGHHLGMHDQEGRCHPGEFSLERGRPRPPPPGVLRAARAVLLDQQTSRGAGRFQDDVRCGRLPS